jgi:hypothetical protein
MWSHRLTCAACGAESALGHRWQAYLADRTEDEQAPQVILVCPLCVRTGAGPLAQHEEA